MRRAIISRFPIGIPSALRWAAWFFFFTYVGLVIVAGAWGIVFGRLDMGFLLQLQIDRITPVAAANLLSQYRFLRALELGFGLFALTFRREIFRIRLYNRLFLFTMGAGVLGRVFGLALDGPPTLLMGCFAVYELVGLITIFAATRRLDTA